MIFEPNLPRVFRLLLELEKVPSGLVTYGLEKQDDNTFTYWYGSIIGPNERIYELKFICEEDYPDKPPKFKFITKINMPGVNQTTGWVDNNQISLLKNWNRHNTLESALDAIRKEMESQAFKKLKQPAEGSVFS
jgi:ubiquitin-conjugating enzyme E2 variant